VSTEDEVHQHHQSEGSAHNYQQEFPHFVLPFGVLTLLEKSLFRCHNRAIFKKTNGKPPEHAPCLLL